jgi:hypothetical protein
MAKFSKLREAATAVAGVYRIGFPYRMKKRKGRYYRPHPYKQKSRKPLVLRSRIALSCLQVKALLFFTDKIGIMRVQFRANP